MLMVVNTVSIICAMTYQLFPGIRHKGVTCSGCDTKDFFGTKWTCSQCKDANLCFLCYSADKHALSHVFVRHDSPGDKG